jgi:cytochrome c-type biogenesis protein CcmH
LSGTFLVACLALSVFAGLLFLWPLAGSGDAGAREDRRRVLTTLYQSRRMELDSEIHLAGTDENTARGLKTELDASLLDDVAATEDAEAQTPPPAGIRWPAVALAVLLPLLAFVIYDRVGNPEAERLRHAREVLELADGDPRIETWREVIEARVERRPKEAESWYLLGHVLLRQQKYARAAEAFSRAKSIVGHDITIETYWLQARYLAADGNVDTDSIRLAESILARDPGNYPVLQLLSVHKARTGDFAGALTLLYRAQNTPLDPTRQAVLQDFIRQVRAHVPVQLPTIDVAVRAAGEVPPQATLFVIARPVGGGVPYAVARYSAQMLPLEVRLDDVASMNPANPLSRAEKVEVVARVSLSGQPAAAPGDWSWTSAPIDIAGMKEPARLEVELAPPATAAQGAH